jgi:hypothetical protein
MNVTQWLPDAFTPALQYEGDLSVNDLNNAVTEFAKSFPADNEKIIPINIDHRENYPPDDTELAALKRFLRTNTAGVPVIVFWPETDEGTAWELSERYIGIAGPASVDLPVKCLGPSPDTWPEIGKHTLYLANDIENLEELGVDPTDYPPSKFHTLGAFLRQISSDFNRKILALRRELEKPVSVVIVFASESAEPGVLAQITSSTKYGLLDGHALVSVTPESEVGRWWSQRRGLLTRSIVQLNASALCLPPASAASCVRNFSESMQLFDDAGYRRYGSARGVRDLLRSDVGKYIINESMSRFEARGTPADEATAAFQLLGDQGFNLGNDKKLNELMACGVEELLKNKGIEFEKITYEEKNSVP